MAVDKMLESGDVCSSIGYYPSKLIAVLLPYKRLKKRLEAEWKYKFLF
jgi:hypothetical protein